MCFERPLGTAVVPRMVEDSGIANEIDAKLAGSFLPVESE